MNPDTKDDVFELAANKSIGLLSKVEKEEGILTILIKMVRRFPKNYNYKKELGLEYRKRGNDAVATKIFEEILLDQNDTLVMAHLGKICVCFVASDCCLVLLQVPKCFGLVQIFCARPKIYLHIVAVSNILS